MNISTNIRTYIYICIYVILFKYTYSNECIYVCTYIHNYTNAEKNYETAAKLKITKRNENVSQLLIPESRKHFRPTQYICFAFSILI